MGAAVFSRGFICICLSTIICFKKAKKKRVSTIYGVFGLSLPWDLRLLRFARRVGKRALVAPRERWVWRIFPQRFLFGSNWLARLWHSW